MAVIGGTKQIPWTDESRELLRKSLEMKMTFREISVEVFQEKYSRSAVASQARKLNLKSCSPSPNNTRSKPVRLRAKTRVSPMALEARAAASKKLTAPVFFEEDKPTNGGPYSILALKHKMCRWPVEGGFCGDEISHGSYCAPHNIKNLRSV